MSVPKSKKAGGNIFLNPYFINLTMYKSGFNTYRGKMNAIIPGDNIDEVVRLLSNMGVKVNAEILEALFHENVHAFHNDLMAHTRNC